MSDSLPQKPHESQRNQPRSFFSFWGVAIKKGWSESREKFGLAVDITLALAAVGLLLFAWYSKQHPKFDADKENAIVSYWLAIIPVGLWLIWFGYHVLKAPYEIYLEMYQKCEAEIGEKECIIKKLETEIECLRAPMLEIEAVTTNIKSARWHSCKIVIHNKSSTKTADNLRVELISLVDELAMAQQAAYFHPPFPAVLNPEASGTNTVNPGDRMQYHLFRVSANQKPAIIKDGAIVGFNQNITAHFNISDAMEHNTAIFKCQEPYRIKLAVSARDFPISEREFELIFVNESNDYQISVKQTLIKV
jgi:hypothetical protein